jgi:hypothetical protein
MSAWEPPKVDLWEELFEAEFKLFFLLLAGKDVSLEYAGLFC